MNRSERQSVEMAVASLLLAPQLGWVATTTFAGQPGDSVLEIQARGGGLNRVWSMPSDESDSSNIGLGGGITYSFASDLCSQLLPLFSEGTLLVSCDQIKAAVAQAFSAWAASSRSNARWYSVLPLIMRLPMGELTPNSSIVLCATSSTSGWLARPR